MNELKKPMTKEEHKGILSAVADFLVPYYPNLRKKLVLANIITSPHDFVSKIVVNTIFLSLTMLLLTTLFFQANGIDFIYLILFIIAYPFIFFNYLVLYPDALVTKRRREIDQEIVFAGRHLVIAVKSGLPLFDAMVGVTKGYGEVSKEFNRIVERVTLGVPLSQALREVGQINPSQYFVRLTVQISNSLSSGADVGDSLEAVLDQISKEQLVQLKEYGQKLTPIVMFFMVFGIILPSLGVILSIVLFSLISGGKLGLTSSILILVFGMITVVQFLFLGMIETSRPKYLV